MMVGLLKVAMKFRREFGSKTTDLLRAATIPTLLLR